MAGLLPNNVHPQRSKYFQAVLETSKETSEEKKVPPKGAEEEEQERTQKQPAPIRPADAVIGSKPIITAQGRDYRVENHRRGLLWLGAMLGTGNLVMAKTGGRGTMVQSSSHTASHNDFIFSANEVLVIDRDSHMSSRDSSKRDDTVMVVNHKGDIGDIPRDLVVTAVLEAKVDPTETVANESADLPGILGVLAQAQHKRRRSPIRRQQVKEARRSSRFDPYAPG